MPLQPPVMVMNVIVGTNYLQTSRVLVLANVQPIVMGILVRNVVGMAIYLFIQMVKKILMMMRDQVLKEVQAQQVQVQQVLHQPRLVPVQHQLLQALHQLVQLPPVPHQVQHLPVQLLNHQAPLHLVHPLHHLNQQLRCQSSPR